MALLDGFVSLLGGSPNQVKGGEEDHQQGVIDRLVPELRYEEDDKTLLERARTWKAAYEKYEGPIKDIQKENERYWLGQHYEAADYKTSKPPQENRIFSDVESFLPIATRQNPEPLVSGGDSEEGSKLAEKSSKMLSYQADIQKLKLKVKKATRFWLLYLVGVVKVGWDLEQNDIKTSVIRPQKIIFEVDSTIEDGKYTGKYLGEYRDAEAGDLIEQFPDKAKEINKITEKKKGTKIGFIEWWTDEYVFWTLEEKLVLGKMKNPHWNYEEEVEETDVLGNTLYDEYGEVSKKSVQLRNHFKAPKMPYIFLSVFNLGKRPHDDSNLIQQVIPTQDRLNDRNKQIDRNVRDMNGGAVVSGDFFTQQEAHSVANAIKNGKTVWVPQGNVHDAFMRQTGIAMPPDVYQNLLDMRQQMDNLFGIHGTSRGERTGPETLGGRILLKSADTDRISFVSDYIEQFVDDIFNYWLQMMYVYYSEEHVGNILGDESAQEFVRLSRSDFQQQASITTEDGEAKQEDISLLVSVREGSLIPKDPLIKRNEAVDLFKMGAIDPITLFERLDFPDPRGTAKKLFIWQSNPQALFPDLESELPPSSGPDLAGSGLPPLPQSQGPPTVDPSSGQTPDFGSAMPDLASILGSSQGVV